MVRNTEPITSGDKAVPGESRLSVRTQWMGRSGDSGRPGPRREPPTDRWPGWARMGGEETHRRRFWGDGPFRHHGEADCRWHVA